jgi:hypothetical protein
VAETLEHVSDRTEIAHFVVQDHDQFSRSSCFPGPRSD